MSFRPERSGVEESSAAAVLAGNRLQGLGKSPGNARFLRAVRNDTWSQRREIGQTVLDDASESGVE
ncbi:hypothetical protein BH24CHL4_BH24CHL4_25320 [soil metagenome]